MIFVRPSDSPALLLSSLRLQAPPDKAGIAEYCSYCNLNCLSSTSVRTYEVGPQKSLDVQDRQVHDLIVKFLLIAHHHTFFPHHHHRPSWQHILSINPTLNGIHQSRLVSKASTTIALAPQIKSIQQLVLQSQLSMIFSSQNLLGDLIENRPGRPHQLTDTEVDSVLQTLRGHYKKSVLPWQRLAQACGLSCSGDTLRRALNAHGYHKCIACPKPYISDAARQKRVDFVTNHADWTDEDWQQVLWSDECTFYTGKQKKDHVIRTRGERFCTDCMQFQFRSNRTSFSIWATIGWDFKSDLVFLEGHGPRGGGGGGGGSEQSRLCGASPQSPRTTCNGSHATDRKRGCLSGRWSTNSWSQRCE